MGAALGELTGANRRQAEAAQKAATAREQVAGESFAAAEQTQADIMDILNNPAAVQQFETSLQAQERQIQRQERLIDSIDPAIKEAATQALQLLQGKEAASLAPVKQQREQQRQQLVNTLRERFGPGAETSSAGIQALTQFDQQTNQLTAQQQQTTLGGLLGVATQNKPDVGLSAGRLAQTIGARTGQQVSDAMAGGQLVQQAFGRRLGEAGSQFVGEGLRAAQQQQIGSDIFKAGLTLATAKSGSKPPTGA